MDLDKRVGEVVDSFERDYRTARNVEGYQSIYVHGGDSQTRQRFVEALRVGLRVETFVFSEDLATPARNLSLLNCSRLPSFFITVKLMFSILS